MAVARLRAERLLAVRQALALVAVLIVYHVYCGKLMLDFKRPQTPRSRVLPLVQRVSDRDSHRGGDLVCGQAVLIIDGYH
jgi:hypothetical protein